MPNQYSDGTQTRLQWLIETLEIKTEECQIWPFSKNHKGYGQVRFQGALRLAHRVAHKLSDPNFNDLLCSLHDCPTGDNPLCFNPRHLFQGTQIENVSDRDRKGRCAQGQRHYASKLTDEKVRDIRKRSKSGESQTSIAADMGVDTSAVNRIVNGRAWKQVN